MLLQPVARTAARARAENFRTLFIVFPLRWSFPYKAIPQQREISRRTYYLLLLVSKRSQGKSCSFFSSDTPLQGTGYGGWLKNSQLRNPYSAAIVRTVITVPTWN